MSKKREKRETDQANGNGLRLAPEYQELEKAFERRRIDDLVVDVFTRRFYDDPFIQEYKLRYPDVARIYELAKKYQWNVTTAIDWNKEVGPEDESKFTPEQKIAGARILSQFYWGEQGAQLVSSQLVGMVDDCEGRNFLSTQTMDEARHVEGFQRMLQRVDKIYPMNPYLRFLLCDIMRQRHLEEKIVGMNFLVEGLALTAFREVVKLGKDPVLEEFLTYFIRDESRHVGFAVKYLPKKIGRLPLDRKLHLKAKQLFWMFLLDRNTRYHQKEAETVGVDMMEVTKTILSEHQERLDEMGLDVMVDTKWVQKLLPLLAF